MIHSQASAPPVGFRGRGLARSFQAWILLSLLATAGRTAVAEQDLSFGTWQRGADAPVGFLATHSTLMRDGRILVVGGSSYYCNFEHGKEAAHFFDPDDDEWSPRLPSPAPYGPEHDAFCSGHAHDDRGGVVFQGGLLGYGGLNGHGIPHSARFDPGTGAFIQLGNAADHWYPTLIAGVDHMYLFPGRETHHDEQGGAVGGFQIRRLPWGGSAWEDTGANILTTATYPRVHLLPNGTYFIASPHGGDWTNVVYNPASGAVTPFGTGAVHQVPKVGAHPNPDRPIYIDWGGTSVLLPLTPEDGGYPVPRVALFNSEKAYVRNLSSAGSTWQEMGVRPAEVPEKQRRHANATLLPTGQVLLSGGIALWADSSAVKTAEIYDPDLDGWLATSAAEFPRNYHSVSLLLPDGRVWTGSSSINEQGSMCGTNDDNTQRAVEFFSPWYVGHPDRPSISNCPLAIASDGQHFTVNVAGGLGNSIGRVALMRPGSVTHAFDGDQRLVYLDIVGRNPSAITVRAPYTPNVAPPGDYMLFALRDRGADQRFKRFAPSEACWTRVVNHPAPPGASIWEHTGVACDGESCPGWRRLDNNHKTVALAADGDDLYQLHHDGWTWRHTGVACNGNACPGWTRLDNNDRTIALAADGGKLYQLHRDGAIWRSTGAPCSGDSCPGWQRLDNNPKTIAIAANQGDLFQLHNDGWVWQHTGAACVGDACPGWRRLDNNFRTIAIAAAGEALYQLHRDGRIWQWDGRPCSGESCPGWRMLDNNFRTVGILAGEDDLFQVHFDGSIWEYTGTACRGESCPGWRRLDNNPKTVAIAAGEAGLIQLHHDGWIWQYTGTPCTSDACPGWKRLDNNPRSGALVSAGEIFQLHTDPLYQRHSDGAIWRYTGTPCSGDACPGWQRLDNNPRTRQIAAGGRQLYQRHDNGEVWRATGLGCSGESCPGWQRLDNNPRTKSIAAGGNQFFQLHSDGKIWRHTGRACDGDSCPGWVMLDNNPRTRQIAASETQLFQRHAGGAIWRHTGKACSGSACPGWERLDNNPRTKRIAAGANQLFQLHSDGKIWRHTGTPCSGNSCPGWQMLDNNPRSRSIAAAGTQLFQLHEDGRIWRFTGKPCSGQSCPGWQLLDNNPRTRQITASGTQLYQRHDNGEIWHYTGPACSGDSCPGWRRLDNNPRTADIEAGYR